MALFIYVAYHDQTCLTKVKTPSMQIVTLYTVGTFLQHTIIISF